MAAQSRFGGLDFSKNPLVKRRRKGGAVTSAVQLIALIGLGLWAFGAIWFQITGGLRQGALIGLAVVVLTLFALWSFGQSRPLWIGLLAFALVSAGWWMTIRPSNTRLWDADVEYGVTAALGTELVTLANVRNFDWRSLNDFTPAWETHSYRPQDVVGMDVFTSTWSSPLIAHTLVSFGFSDGQHIVFSAEIRREKGEEFSNLGGLFRQFELVLIAADERDIIRLRTDIRGESVSRYPLNLPQPMMAEAFRVFATLGNDLAANPKFYNTITSNCTTIPFRLARQIDPAVPFDWRILLSGHFAAYLRDLGVTGQNQSLNDMLALARLPKTGAAEHDGPAFSARIRTNATN
jgi:hypothetical protein